MIASQSVAVIGGGWAGLAAAIAAVQAGARVTLYEASRVLGGRARTLMATAPGGRLLALDNGQHVLAGAYTATLGLMRSIGLDPDMLLLRQTLDLRHPDNQGLALSELRPPWDVLLGIARAQGWSWRDRIGLLRAARRWRAMGFRCAESLTVTDLCEGLSVRVQRELVEPLCVSALNTPAHRASGQVFLRVLGDAVFGTGEGGMAGSTLLLPRCDLGRLLPQPAAHWLAQRGTQLRLGRRVQSIARGAHGWLVDGEAFDAVVLATTVWEAQRLVGVGVPQCTEWAQMAGALRHEAIATVYAESDRRLQRPMVALPSDADAPAQFVFDRGLMTAQPGVLAFVVSAARGDRDHLERAVVMQAAHWGHRLKPILTVVEKRATFACTPGLRRPGPELAPGLVACGDYVQGPYPATLEGAVRSGQTAIGLLQGLHIA